MQVTIQDFRTEFVQKGRGGYNKGTAVYTDGRGQNKEKIIFSFANPGVYETLKNLKLPAAVEVHMTKNDKGYDEWAKVEIADVNVAVPATSTTPKSGSLNKSTYETAEERAARQVLIVRQSCLAQAVALLKGTDENGVDDVLSVSDKFVDWVFKNNIDLFQEPNELPE